MGERQSTASKVKVEQLAADHEQLVGEEMQRVLDQLTPIIDQYRKAFFTSTGKKVVPEKLSQRAREQVNKTYTAAVEMVANAVVGAMERAELMLHVSELLTEHLDDEAKAAAERELYMEDLPELLGTRIYSVLGREFATVLQEGPVTIGDEYTVPEAMDQLNTLPSVVRGAVIKRFVELGLLDYSETEDAETQIVFGKNKHAADRLRNGAVETARLVHKIVYSDVKPREFTSLDDVLTTYNAHDEASSVNRVELESATTRAKILPINELRIGHQDAKHGLELVRETIDLLATLTEEERPNVILVTNLIQGDFKHLQSGRRAALAEGVNTNDQQFRVANLLLEELRATGIPVVLSLGRDDHRIAKDYTVDVMGELRGIAKSGGKENFIPYYQLNKIEEDAQFQKHRKFQLEYAMPLCYLLGRSLRTADEVEADTNGELNTSEYLALYAHIKHGEPLPPELGIDPALLVGLGEWRDGVCVVDDVDLVVSTEESETEIWYRHSVSGFTPETLLQNHMDSVLGALGAMGTNDVRLPNAIMTGGSQEAVYATRSNSGAISLPGLTDPGQAMGRKGQHTAVQGDPTRRMNLLRKRPSSPAISMYEQWDTGEIALSYINRDLMERADSLPRMAVIELCDFQIGSPTARPDYQIKYLSYILELAKNMPIAIQFAGDIIHGNIYPGFGDESQAIGLIKIESQKQMVSGMLKRAFWNVPDSLLNSVVDVLVQQGNHDEIQKKRTPNNHDNNIDYIIKDFEGILDKEPSQQSRVRHNSIFRTGTGVPVPTWMGRSEYGAYDILTAHYHVNRGMKGNSGGLPVYHPYARAVGLGNEERANILMGAHWHNPQSAVLGNKLVVVGGAMAEQSQFEDMLGYSAALSGTIVFIGGSKPPKVLSVTPEALDHHGVKHGWFTPENLSDQGFHDDQGFDVRKHGPYSPDYLPKSGLQKALLALGREASQLTMFEAPMQGENVYDTNGNPVTINSQTRRAMAVAAEKGLTTLSV